jgi:hypothetical protein
MCRLHIELGYSGLVQVFAACSEAKIEFVGFGDAAFFVFAILVESDSPFERADQFILVLVGLRPFDAVLQSKAM